MSTLPGVTSAAIASAVPLSDGGPSDQPFQIDRLPSAVGARGPHSGFVAVSPEYFRTVGIPLLHGRAFTAADRDTLNPPVIVSRRLASTYWGSRDPIGTRITPDSGKTWATVVGVVGDVRQNRLDGDVTDEIYYPVAVAGLGDVRVFLRTTGAMPPVVRALRAIVADVDPQQPVSSIETLEQIRGAQLAEPRLTATVLTSFAALALILTATGLAGVIGYSVTQRLPEIAIRIALGADSRRVVALVVRDGLAIVGTGLVIGFVISLFGIRLVTRLPFHVAANDATTFVLACVLIALMAAAAFLIPSRRALRTDPAGVFRGA